MQKWMSLCLQTFETRIGPQDVHVRIRAFYLMHMYLVCVKSSERPSISSVFECARKRYLSYVDHPIFGNGTWSTNASCQSDPDPCRKQGGQPRTVEQPTSSTGSRWPFQLSQDLSWAVYFPSHSFMLFFCPSHGSPIMTLHPRPPRRFDLFFPIAAPGDAPRPATD
jgi:hypothetical protein